MSEPTPFRYERADDSPGLLLWRLTALWQRRVAAALEPFGVTQTQYAILASVRWFDEHGEQPTQRHLVEHTGLDKMTLSKAVRRLEAAGLVSRRSSPRDARATLVRLTAEGRDRTGKAILAVEDADETFFAGLDHEALRAWMALGRALTGDHPATRAGTPDRPRP